MKKKVLMIFALIGMLHSSFRAFSDGSSTVTPGTKVQLFDLKTQHYNGRQGTVTGYHAGTHYLIKLENQETKAFPFKNVLRAEGSLVTVNQLENHSWIHCNGETARIVSYDPSRSRYLINFVRVTSKDKVLQAAMKEEKLQTFTSKKTSVSGFDPFQQLGRILSDPHNIYGFLNPSRSEKRIDTIALAAQKHEEIRREEAKRKRLEEQERQERAMSEEIRRLLLRTQRNYPSDFDNIPNTEDTNSADQQFRQSASNFPMIGEITVFTSEKVINCPICLTQFESNDRVLKLNCNCDGSLYHPECIKKWIKEEHSNCPTCRQEF